jgi:hypothetical protein
LSASFWIGARLRWASATIRTIRERTVSAPTFSARTIREPVLLIVAPMTFSPALLFHGNRLAGNHRLVHVALPLDHLSVHRDFLSRPHPQNVV